MVNLHLKTKNRAVDALSLLGNSISHTSQIRRKRVLKVCNPDKSSLADRNELFTKAPPMLFGEGFELKMKERAEALKVLHKSQTTSTQLTQSQRKPYFQNNHPSYPTKGRRLPWTAGTCKTDKRISELFHPVPNGKLQLPKERETIKTSAQSGQLNS